MTKKRVTVFALAIMMILPVISFAQITATGKTGNLPQFSGTRAVLYEQLNYAPASNITSQDFEAAFDPYDNQGADDFVVPAGLVWNIQTITAVGSGSTTANLVNLFIYADDSGQPAASPLYSFMSLTCDNTGAILTIDIPGGIQLPPGHYWLSVQYNAAFGIYGQWYWYNVATIYNNQAAWRNPGNGFGTGFTDWTPIVALPFLDYSNCDFAYVLEGDSGPYNPGIPLSNWALVIGGMLIAAFTVFMIRRRM